MRTMNKTKRDIEKLEFKEKPESEKNFIRLAHNLKWKSNIIQDRFVKKEKYVDEKHLLQDSKKAQEKHFEIYQEKWLKKRVDTKYHKKHVRSSTGPRKVNNQA